MKLELVIIAQSLARIDIELARIRAAMTDVLRESVGDDPLTHLAPVEPSVPIPIRRRGRTHVGVLRAAIEASVPADGIQVQDLFALVQAEVPGVQMSTVRTHLSNLCTERVIERVSYGCYRAVERKPHLQIQGGA